MMKTTKLLQNFIKQVVGIEAPQLQEQHSNLRYNSKSQEKENLSEYLTIFSPSEISLIIDSRISNLEMNIADPEFKKIFYLENKKENFISSKLIDVFHQLNIIDFVTPLHTEDLHYVENTLPSLANYFGENVAFYFEFMNHYRKWLIIPAIAGLIVTYIDETTHQDTNHSPMESLFSILVLFWATLFMIFWERRSNVVSTRWGSYGQVFKRRNRRADFKGEIRMNLVTEMPEFYYPSVKRFFHYFVSFLAMIPILFVSFYSMIFFFYSTITN